MFDITNLMPHGMCFQWRPELLLAHGISDGITTLAYFSIPLSIIYITNKRPILKAGKIYQLFIAFILACGLGHFLSIWTLWYPDYYLQALSKVFTASISIYAAYHIWRLAPVLLKIPSIAEYEAKKKALQEEISAHQRTEESLQEQKKLTWQLQETLNEFALISVTDETGKIIHANGKFCEVSGYTLDELIGQNHRLINSGYHDAEFFRNLWNTIRSGQTWRGEIRNMRRSGTCYWVDAMIRPLCNEHGIIYRYVSIRREITAEVENRETLVVEKQDAERTVWSILDNLTAYAAIKDSNGKMIYANPMTCKLFGKTQEEVLGNNCQDFFDGDTGATISQDELQVLREGLSVNHEEIIMTPITHEPRFVLSSKVPLYNEDGSIKGLLVISNDITEQKMSERRVEELAQFNQSVLDSLNAKVCVLDSTGTIIAVNRAWTDASDCSLNTNPRIDTNYLQACDSAPPEDNAAHEIANGLREILDGSRNHYALEYSTNRCCADNHPQNPEILTWYLLDATRFPGSSVKIVVSHTNITELRQLGVKLKDNETLLATVLDNIGAYVYMKSPELRYLYVNPQCAALFGYSSDEMIGLLDAEMTEQHIADEFGKLDRLVFETGERVEGMETITLAGDTNPRYLWSVKLPMRQENGNISALFGISADITERKRLEDEKLQLMEKSARLKTEFLANISHEIRTPMNSVMGVTELLRDTALSSEQSHYLDILQFSCQHVLCLINDMLELSKIQSGHWTLEKRPFKLSEMLTAILKGLVPLAHNKGLTLAQNVNPQVPDDYCGSPLRLGQIITNLVGNAIKFTHHGGVTVTITEAENQSIATESDQIVIRFAVIDTGLGIPYEHQERIFKAFEQIERGDNSHIEGTGLGLTISSTLVYLMGGQLKVDSTEGIGSTFYFELPLHRYETGQDVLGNQQPPQISLENKRVLLVDDNDINLELVAARLNKLGCIIVTAEHGQKALEILQNERFDLILMDMRMPIMDGPTATRLFRLREQELRLARTPVIALTANAHEEDVKTCIESGMDGHIGKPFTVEMLMQGIARVYQQMEQETGKFKAIYQDENPVFVVFDVAAALEMVAGDEDLLAMIESKFVERYPELLSQIHTAINLGDAELGRDVAHTLKGNTGYLCAHELRQYAALMENLFGEGQLDKASAALESFERAADRLMKAIAEHRNE